MGINGDGLYWERPLRSFYFSLVIWLELSAALSLLAIAGACSSKRTAQRRPGSTLFPMTLRNCGWSFLITHSCVATPDLAFDGFHLRVGSYFASCFISKL